jgi:hypothetical protein
MSESGQEIARGRKGRDVLNVILDQKVPAMGERDSDREYAPHRIHDDICACSRWLAGAAIFIPHVTDTQRRCVPLDQPEF